MSKILLNLTQKKETKLVEFTLGKKNPKISQFLCRKIAKFRHKKYTGHYYYTSFLSLRQTVAGSLRFADCESGLVVVRDRALF
jgi:hypothetical protein